MFCVLCRKNKTVQEHLYDHMDDLLQLDVAVPDMAEVLTEVCKYIQLFFINNSAYYIAGKFGKEKLWRICSF